MIGIRKKITAVIGGNDGMLIETLTRIGNNGINDNMAPGKWVNGLSGWVR